MKWEDYFLNYNLIIVEMFPKIYNLNFLKPNVPVSKIYYQLSI